MQKLENSTLQGFLERLAEELKNENEDREWNNQSEEDKKSIFNIPFLISSLWEAFKTEPNTYSDFIKCIKKSYDYQINIVEPDNDYYGICKAIIGFHVTEIVSEKRDKIWKLFGMSEKELEKEKAEAKKTLFEQGWIEHLLSDGLKQVYKYWDDGGEFVGENIFNLTRGDVPYFVGYIGQH